MACKEKITMFIKRIDSFDEDSGEAYLIVSDGTYDVMCYCSLFQNKSQIIPEIKQIETFFCDGIMRAYDENFLIAKKKDYFSYHLQGKVLDVDKRIVSVGNIIINLDMPLPKDIKNNEFIEFDVLRLDCYIREKTMQNILSKGRLLDSKGELIEAGYSLDIVREYCRADIKAGKMRIKEWDYYLITNKDYGVALTIDDNSYMSLASVSFLNFKDHTYITKSQIKFFSCGKLGMPSSFKLGNINYDTKKVKGAFLNQNNKRVLRFSYKNFDGDKDFECEFVLTNEPKEKMVIATPFNKPKHFYYNAKINCMVTSGYAKIGDTRYEFSDKDTLTTLDWGRGVWTYKNEWYWGSLQCYLDDGKRFGFNIGYGFGDTSKASENMLFVENTAHKLDQVVFNIPKDANGNYDYLKPWTFNDNENRFNLNFTPIIDRYDYTNAVIISSKQHQVFGYFSGEVVLDDGSKLVLDNKLGFAEHVMNKW